MSQQAGAQDGGYGGQQTVERVDKSFPEKPDPERYYWEYTDYGHISSGVPQGRVIGPPCLNELSNTIPSEVRLFADDTIIYTTTN